ncbi:MAG: beta-propeller domain-containing protein, partial [Candidatus Hydrogenedentes bacterium]|nr:beta-propeller domain-containing protein [Candidatus Hydrogenedentota bacterium]
LADPDVLRVLGQTTIEGASGETLFATRFDGPRGYLVTYLLVDPLFVLDLSDPAKPAVSGVLEVPGWSTHIEPQGDRLVALGVDDTDGRRVSVSLFDVSDPYNPTLADRVSCGKGWSWSNAYTDVKAFTVLDDTLIVPFSGWHEDIGGFERLQFISYEGLDLTLRGFVDLDGQVLRSFAHADAYYGVTTEQVAVINGDNLDNPVVTKSIVLAEYVEDYLELPGGRTAELVSHFDSGETTIRGAANGVAAGEITLPVVQPVAVEPYGDGIVMVTTGWDDKAYYRIDLVSLNDSGKPDLENTIFAEVDPYWGGWWWDGPMPVADGMDIAPAYGRYWGTPEETVFLLGDRLALRCTGNSYDVEFGGKNPYQGIAVVNLASGVLERTIGLGFDRIEAIVPSGDALVVNTAEDAGLDLALRPLVAYFVRPLNISAPALGDPANVPGRVLEYDAAVRILTLHDAQYTSNGEIRQLLRTASWTGGALVRPLDALDLPNYTGTILARGKNIYLDHYDTGYHAVAITMDSAGNLAAAGDIKVTDQWANLVDAAGGDLIVNVAGAFIGHYRLEAKGLEQAQLVEVMMRPDHVRFGEDTIYAPLGYAGLELLERGE